MNRHETNGDDTLELASLHSLGALPPEEAAAYEAHLATCDVCRREAESLRLVADSLANAAPEASPPPLLRDRVLAEARDADRSVPAQVWKSWRPTTDDAAPPLHVALSDDAPFEATGFPGVEARRLHVDPARDRVTMLVRMAAGARYPAHRHAGPEHCYVVSGDLRSGEVRMRAGDYKLGDAGSFDGEQSTEEGCLLFIVSSLHDEILVA